jgi:hypothetical protein
MGKGFKVNLSFVLDLRPLFLGARRQISQFRAQEHALLSLLPYACVQTVMLARQHSIVAGIAEGAHGRRVRSSVSAASARGLGPSSQQASQIGFEQQLK